MHRNSGRLAYGHKKRAEAMPRLHRFCRSHIRDLSSVNGEAAHQGHLPSPRPAGRWGAGRSPPNTRLGELLFPAVLPANVHSCAVFHICVFCVKFSICGFGHTSASFRKADSGRHCLWKASPGLGTTIDHNDGCFMEDRQEKAARAVARLGAGTRPGPHYRRSLRLDAFRVQAAGWRPGLAVARCCAG